MALQVAPRRRSKYKQKARAGEGVTGADCVRSFDNPATSRTGEKDSETRMMYTVREKVPQTHA